MIGAGLSEFPIGGFPLSDSVSIGDPLIGLLSDTSIKREYLLRATPDSGATIVDLSSSGYFSDPTDTPYKLFPGCLGRPYNFSVDLPLPDLKGGGRSGAGEIRVNNPEGLRDTEALADWLGADADVYVGEKRSALTAFTRFFHGKSSGVVWDLQSWSVLHRDTRFRLQRQLQPSRYMGVGPCLKFDGSGDYVSYGDVLDQGASDSFTVEVLYRSTATGATKTLQAKKNPGAANAGWALLFQADNDIEFNVTDGVDSVSAVATANNPLYLNGGMHRLSAVVDRSAQLIRLYLDGTLIATSASLSAVGTLTNAQDLRVGAFSDGSLSFNGYLDDFRFWSIARTQTDIQADMHHELIGTETGLQIYTKYNEGSGTTADDSTSNNRDGTITGAAWAGSLEGDASVAGRVKPVLVGRKRQISPVLVDYQRLVYQVHDGSMNALLAVKDAGDEYTFGSDLSDIYSAVPGAGTYNTSLSSGLFRLGSSPVGVITCDAEGDDSGIGYAENVSDIHRKLAIDYGGLSSSDLDLTSYSELELLTTAVTGKYFSDEINVDAAMDSVMSDSLCWWVPNRVGKLTVGRIENPSTLTPQTSITEEDIVDPNVGGVFRSEPVGVRVGQVVLGYKRYDTVLSDDQVAGVLTLAERADLGKEYRFITATDPNRTEDADTITVLTEFDDAVDAQEEADRILAMLKEDRRLQTLSLDQGVLSYFIGSIFLVTLDRYDLVSGKVFIVVGVSEDIGEYGTVDSLQVKLFG